MRNILSRLKSNSLFVLLNSIIRYFKLGTESKSIKAKKTEYVWKLNMETKTVFCHFKKKIDLY